MKQKSAKRIGLAIVGAGRVRLMRGEIAARFPCVDWIGIAEIDAGEGVRLVSADQGAGRVAHIAAGRKTRAAIAVHHHQRRVSRAAFPTRQGEKRMNHALTQITCGLLLSLACGLVSAQDYPSRPISIIVPAAPGGTNDINARQLAPALTKVLGQTVVVVNRPGAGGAIGTAFVANSKPDGYTLIMPLATASAIPVADQLYGRKPSFTMEQFTSIARISADPNLLGTHVNAPWKSINDLVMDARQNPGRIRYGTSGNYGPSHFMTEMFAHAAGIKLHHVPYGGGGPALIALLGGEVALAPVTPAQAMPHVQAGKVRILGNGGAKRIAVLPDVPTFRELGYDFEYHLWVGMYAPAGTPAPVVTLLRDAVRQAAQSPEFVQSMAKVQVQVAYLDAPEFEKFWREDARRVADVVKRIGRIE